MGGRRAFELPAASREGENTAETRQEKEGKEEEEEEEERRQEEVNRCANPKGGTRTAIQHGRDASAAVKIRPDHHLITRS